MQISGSACNMIGGVIGVLGWSLRFARLMLAPKAVLAAKLLAAETPRPGGSQLVACTDAVERKRAPKPKFTLSFDLQPTGEFVPGAVPSLGLRNSVDKSYALTVLIGIPPNSQDESHRLKNRACRKRTKNG